MRDLQRIDLNLLVAFDALVTEQSVTRAAERMHVGQPAMSASLARLRKLFDDPLLVRVGRRSDLTPVAESLAGPVRQAIMLLEGVVGRRRSFDPHLDGQTFTVLASDYVLLVLLRSMLQDIEADAPAVRVNVRPIGGDYADQMRRGQADLFILPREIEQSGGEFRSEDLFQDRLICAVDVDHPSVGDVISLQQFKQLPYLAYDGGQLQSAAQHQIRALAVERSIEVTTQSFVVAPLMLRGTSFLTLVYERLGRTLASQARIKLLEAPIDLHPITEAMFWGPHLDADPAHRWLRERIAHAALSLASS